MALLNLTICFVASLMNVPAMQEGRYFATFAFFACNVIGIGGAVYITWYA